MKLNSGAPETTRNLANTLAVVAILLLAAGLRLWGIHWGLPSATHYVSYHPDESRLLFVALSMDSLHGRLLPGFYNYPTLQIYLVNFTETLAYLLGAADFGVADLSHGFASVARLFLIARLLSMTMGVATVGLIYAIGRRLWGTRAGLLAALFLAIAPLHAQQSHWLTVDVPATFWVMLALYWAARLTEPAPDGALSQRPSSLEKTGRGWLGLPLLRKEGAGERFGLVPAVWAGLAAGFAAATKYNAALAVLPVLAALLIAARGARSRRWAVASAVAVIVAFAAAFLIGCPGSVLQHAMFLRDLNMESLHVRSQPGDEFADTGSGFLYQWTVNLWAGLGWPLLLMSIAGVVYAVGRRDRGDALLAAFALPYYLLISLAAVRYARYAMPLLPILALWSGRLAADVVGASRSALKRGGGIAVLVTAAATLAIAVWLIAPMAAADPRDEALAWIDAHGLRDAPAGFAAMPWFQAPPLDPLFCGSQRGAWRLSDITPPDWQNRYRYRDKDWDLSVLDSAPPIVILSQYDYRDALRLHRPAAEAWLAVLRQNYTVGAVYGGYGHHTIDAVGLPHDMMYTNPTTWVFVRK